MLFFRQQLLKDTTTYNLFSFISGLFSKGLSDIIHKERERVTAHKKGVHQNTRWEERTSLNTHCFKTFLPQKKRGIASVLAPFPRRERKERKNTAQWFRWSSSRQFLDFPFDHWKKGHRKVSITKRQLFFSQRHVFLGAKVLKKCWIVEHAVQDCCCCHDGPTESQERVFEEREALWKT